MRQDSGLIWIQGAGELASGVALRLARAGYRIIMAEVANPLAVRRLVSFSEAVYEGEAVVEGMRGVLVEDVARDPDGAAIRVVVDPLGKMIPLANPAGVVDARMTKRPPVSLPAGKCPTIGLGPGFRCGRGIDLIVETHRGARLGEVIHKGEALANTGVPGVVGGQSARRVVYSPAAGHFVPETAIGDLVLEGQRLGTVAELPVLARLDGMVRGLVHPLAELSPGEKVGDVDPRGEDVDPALVTDKALAVAGGVLEGLLASGILPQSRR
jgi:xanthine dehydrogenase accessory factor